MGGPSPEKGPGNRRRFQVDTTPNRRKTILYQAVPGDSFAVNRTVVHEGLKALQAREAFFVHRGCVIVAAI